MTDTRGSRITTKMIENGMRTRDKSRIEKLEALVEWCKPDEHSPQEHWAAYRECFPTDRSGGADGG